MNDMLFIYDGKKTGMPQNKKVLTQE
jgi:hypothetical protein